jgi:hypothetical protein
MGHKAKKNGASNLELYNFFTLVFQPPLIIKNSLPCSLRVRSAPKGCQSPSEPESIAPGHSINVYSINIRREKAVTIEVFPPGAAAQSKIITLPKSHHHCEPVNIPVDGSHGGACQDDFRAVITVSVDEACDQMILEALSPCWLLNKTGLPIEVWSGCQSVVKGVQSNVCSFVCKSTRSRPLSSELEKPILLGHSSALFDLTAAAAAAASIQIFSSMQGKSPLLHESACINST